MLAKLTFKQKKILAIAIMGCIVFIAYQFSFKSTISALQLNNELQKEETNAKSLDQSFPQVEHTNKFYLEALKTYRVSADDRENRLWQAVSGMALAKAVAINFNQNPPVDLDTVQFQHGVVKQQFTFKGSYSNLVKLLDTLSKSKAIGKISELKLATGKEIKSNPVNELTLQLTLIAIEK